MINNRMIRAEAWNALRGKWKVFFPIMLFSTMLANAFGLRIICDNFFSSTISIPVKFMSGMIEYPISVPKGIGIVLSGLAMLFMLIGFVTDVGEYRLSENILDSKELRVGLLFPEKVFVKAVVMSIIKYFLIGVGTMVFIIPGLVMACNYSKANYILARNPELGPIEALRASREQMYGKRLAYFSLQMSFLPWLLLIYLIENILASLIYRLTWQGDVIFSIFSWVSTAFLLGYMRTASVVFFRKTEFTVFNRNEADYAAEDKQTEESIAEEEKKREEEQRRKEENEARAEAMFVSHKYSRRSLNRVGMLREYESLGLAKYREDMLRRDYVRELMFRFDTDPTIVTDIADFCEEYALDDLTDRALARIRRYEREGNVTPEQVLQMDLEMLKVLHSGAFAENPGFAARKQADALTIADVVNTKYAEADPDGLWKSIYEEIIGMCGVEA